MYRGKITAPVTCSYGTTAGAVGRSNLTKILFTDCNSNVAKQLKNLSEFIRRIQQMESYKNLREVKAKMYFWLDHSRTGFFVRTMHDRLAMVPRSLKQQSAQVLRIWAHQCECVLAQRLRRGQQMFLLYTKMWDERRLKDFIRQMRRSMTLKGRDFVLGAVGMGAYNWDKNRIPDSELKSHFDDLDYVHKLKEHTVCPPCNEKDQSKCLCQENSPQMSSFEDWRVFIKKKDLIVWRRLSKSGHYEYKVYGSYDDVSAEDFLNVQIDTAYRRKWDTTAVALQVIEKDPTVGSNSDVIYWEMQWPRLFANRDYVFHRRFYVDHKSKTLLVMSKSTVHPECPERSSIFRIKDYWSVMVVKPQTELNQKGIEFCLTYYDNPGVNIPASVTTWVAMRAMPDFLERLREATKKYRQYCTQTGVCKICNIMDFEQDFYDLKKKKKKKKNKSLNPKNSKNPLDNQAGDDDDDDDDDDDGIECDLDLFYEVITDNTIFEAQYDLKSRFERNRDSIIKKRRRKSPPPPPSCGENSKNSEEFKKSTSSGSKKQPKLKSGEEKAPSTKESQDDENKTATGAAVEDSKGADVEAPSDGSSKKQVSREDDSNKPRQQQQQVTSSGGAKSQLDDSKTAPSSGKTAVKLENGDSGKTTESATSGGENSKSDLKKIAGDSGTPARDKAAAKLEENLEEFSETNDSSGSGGGNNNNSSSSEISTEKQQQQQPQEKNSGSSSNSYWKYFYPTYYFHS